MTDLTAIRVATGEAGGQGGGDGVSTHLHAPPSAFASTAAGGSIHTRRPPDRFDHYLSVWTIFEKKSLICLADQSVTPHWWMTADNVLLGYIHPATLGP